MRQESDFYTLDIFDGTTMRRLPRENQKARQLRAEGIARVLQHADASWVEYALQGVLRYAKEHREFIGEDFRVWYLLNGGMTPHHHNAWGALLNVAVKKGIVAPTDRMRQMNTEKSHARRSPLWASKVYEGKP